MSLIKSIFFLVEGPLSSPSCFRVIGITSEMVNLGINVSIVCDNRKDNLRLCSNSENMQNQRMRKDNSSGYKGIEKCGSTFRASVTVNGTTFRSSMFKTSIEAAKAYDDIAVKLHGEFARTNKMLGLIQ